MIFINPGGTQPHCGNSDWSAGRFCAHWSLWSLAWETNFSLVYLYHICLHQAHISGHLWAIFTNQQSSHIVTIRFSSHRSTAAGTKLPLQLEQISLTASRHRLCRFVVTVHRIQFFFSKFVARPARLAALPPAGYHAVSAQPHLSQGAQGYCTFQATAGDEHCII